MDRLLIERRLESLRRCLRRVEQRCPASVDALVADADADFAAFARAAMAAASR